MHKLRSASSEHFGLKWCSNLRRWSALLWNARHSRFYNYFQLNKNKLKHCQLFYITRTYKLVRPTHFSPWPLYLTRTGALVHTMHLSPWPRFLTRTCVLIHTIHLSPWPLFFTRTCALVHTLQLSPWPHDLATFDAFQFVDCNVAARLVGW